MCPLEHCLLALICLDHGFLETAGSGLSEAEFAKWSHSVQLFLCFCFIIQQVDSFPPAEYKLVWNTVMIQYQEGDYYKDSLYSSEHVPWLISLHNTGSILEVSSTTSVAF